MFVTRAIQPPRPARVGPVHLPLLRTWSKDLSVLKAVTNSGYSAGHNASLVSAAGCWDFLGSQSAPKTQGRFANATTRLAFWRHPLP